MDEYVKQAKDFLESANAEMKIKFLGIAENSHWDKPRDMYKYHFTIITPKGKMEGTFWKSPFWAYSVYDTESPKEKPSEYDILACLTKWDVGTMDEFMSEFGYEIKSAKDMSNFIYTYNAVQKEYKDLCRIFTEEQMEELREIQ